MRSFKLHHRILQAGGVQVWIGLQGSLNVLVSAVPLEVLANKQIRHIEEWQEEDKWSYKLKALKKNDKYREMFNMDRGAVLYRAHGEKRWRKAFLPDALGRYRHRKNAYEDVCGCGDRQWSQGGRYRYPLVLRAVEKNIYDRFLDCHIVYVSNRSIHFYKR